MRPPVGRWPGACWVLFGLVSQGCAQILDIPDEVSLRDNSNSDILRLEAGPGPDSAPGATEAADAADRSPEEPAPTELEPEVDASLVDAATTPDITEPDSPVMSEPDMTPGLTLDASESTARESGAPTRMNDAGPAPFDASPSCVEGSLSCTEDDALLVCEDGNWDVQTQCETTCSQGACALCVPGERECRDDNPQVCDENGRWTSLAPCNTACRAGVCTVCVPGTTRCLDGGEQTCTPEGSWNEPTECLGRACLSDTGRCGGRCAPGTRQCTSSGEQRTCNARGEWDSVPCPNAACVAGECSTCRPEETRCQDGVSVETCESTGSWAPLPTDCGDAACVLGVCVGECRPGKVRCSPTDTSLIEICGDTGAWLPSASCAPGMCADGACTDCSTGAERCTLDGKRSVCNGAGAWGAPETCSDQTCVDGRCAGECEAGTVTCEGNSPARCDVEGVWEAAAACKDSTCVSGSCQGECVAGAASCLENTPTLCSAAGTWVAEGPCVDQTCIGGSCQGECESGVRTCGSNSPLVCSALGNWALLSYPCDGPEEICRQSTTGTPRCELNTPYILGRGEPLGSPGASTRGYVFAQRIEVTEPVRLLKLGLVGFVPNGPNFHIGLYDSDSEGKPNDLLTPTSINPQKVSNSAVTANLSPAVPLEPGVYWVSVLYESSISIQELEDQAGEELRYALPADTSRLPEKYPSVSTRVVGTVHNHFMEVQTQTD